MRSSLRQRFATVSATAWLVALVLLAGLLLHPESAVAQQGGAFDHLTTGFALTGKHEDVRCETCHIKGIFKGTPRDCGTCHVQNNQRGAIAKPAQHIQTSKTCDTCHVTSAFSAVLFSHATVDPGTCATCHNNVQATGKPANHVTTTASCDQCHSTVAFAPVLRFDHTAASFGTWTCTTCHDGRFAKGKPPNHVPTLANSVCETCHQASVTGGYQSFAGGQMTHTGYSTTGCAQCHAPSVANSFFGVRIVSSATVPPHVPASDTCETCHQAIPAQLIPATGAAGVGGTTFAGGRMSHVGITTNCAQCHGPDVTTGTFIGVTPKTNAGLAPQHLPTSTACESCHTNAIPAMLIPAAGAAGVGGTTFANGQMSHQGITNNCAVCHGPGVGAGSFFGISSIVAMPPTSPAGANSHIPSSITCETCHLASTPAGLMAANATKTAPGTAFATPVPTTAQIHTGVTSGCNACHETASMWMGVANYPIAPSVLTSGAQYTGFHTRPTAAASTYAVADPAHPSTGDCSQCHSSTNYFDNQVKPANHIPYAATAQCNSCHTNADFSVLPTLANIHAFAPSTTTNCAQCHGAAAASFAIPAANFSIVGLPTNHIPTSAACESCHVGTGSSVPTLPVPNGAKFSGSLMNHAGITNNCVTCHVASGSTTTFAGITSIVGMPPTSPVGASSHIPSSTTCETCHLGSLANVSGMVAANATKTAPGSLFATPVPTTAQVHTGVTSGCSNCHEASYVWMGVNNYPIAPTTLTSGAQYTGFQTRPRAAAGTFNVADAAHPNTGDCSQCHSGTNFFSATDKPANHIPYAATAQCNSCHTSTDFSVLPTLANIHANAPSTTTNCAQCHGAAAASFAIPAANFSIVGLPTNHIPTSAACESCHVGTGSSVPTLPVPNGAKFSGSLMSHTGITNNCVACHVASGSATTFVGITSIVGMPPTSPVGASSHIPSSTTCETCHLGSTPAGKVPANATKTAPGTLFATPVPTTAQIHTGVTSGCSSCHEASYVWMGVSNYPIAPAVLTNGAQYTGFQTRPRAAAGTFNVADAAHPNTGDCSQCHSGTNFFSATDKPANHIPYAATAQCNSCHTSTDFSVLPTLANIHANAPSTTTNCAQCHGAAAASFAIPAANFSIVGLPTNHIPTSAACESCHVGTGSSVPTLPVPNGAKFSGSRMNHAGITSNCVSCHLASGSTTSFVGITSIVGMPPTSPVGASSHIPSSTTCETCHLGSLANVSGQIVANATRTAPGSLFATPVPSTAQIHTGVTSGCNSCHEASFVWMGMSSYPIAPAVLTNGAQYTGFQTRPRAAAGTFNVADAAHPNTGDCSQCHSGTNFFTAQDKPANHIPYVATASCTTCHTSTDFSVMPTLANIHANAPSTTTNCAQCHGAAAASFAIPAANFSIVGLPTNHIPTSAACESCHVGTGSSVPTLPVPNGAKFSGSRMNHAGITNNCVSCHVASGTTVTFTGITSIVGMPPTSPMGASSHIPSGTTCESCHLATLANVSGLVPANATKTAPGSLFLTPAPTTGQIHAGVTSGCSNCHEAGYVWMSVSAYPIAPTVKTTGAQYTGFQTRPRAAAGTYSVADAAHPSTGDCSQCHSGTNFFTGQDKPANHIPTSTTAQCTACHTNPDFSVLPTLANIHANAPSTTTNCAQCHGAAAASFAIPAANFSIVGLPTNHIPTSAACESCHVGTGSSVPTLPVPNGAKFSGSRMNHAGITNNCVSCHVASGTSASFAGITSIVGMPPTSPVGASSHVPSSTTCESCHLGTLANVSGLIVANATRTAPGSLFATPAPTTVQIHTGITSGCNSCHEAGYLWMGMSAYPIAPTTLTSGAQYTGFQTRPRAAASTFSVADAAHPTTGDCSQCHSGTNFFTATDKPANHIPTSTTAQCTACHTNPDFSVLPTLANIHANAPSTTTNCAQCHGAAAASFAIPAANFSIVGLPTNHIPTSAACESCHVGTGSSVPTLPVPNGAKFSGSRMNHAGITNNCVSCHVASGTSASFAGITSIVGMPPTSPVGASSHVPSSTTCESCHLGTLANVSGLIVANATRTAPGSLFATPAPTTVQIHTGITSGCNSCHEAGYLWMGMSAYPIAPTTLTSGANYTGFHTRPRAAASTFSVADAAHPTTGDCSQCHSGTNFFSAQAKPTGHIPTTLATCSTCHVTAGDFSITGLTTSMPTMHTGIASGCAACHTAGTGAGPFAGCTTQATCAAPPPLTYQPKTMPLDPAGTPTSPSALTHVPTGGAACEKCHSPTVFTSFAGMNMKGNTNAHNAVSTFTCITCHEGTPKYTWFGVTIVTRPVGHEGRKAGQDCISSGCHNRSFNQFSNAARVRPMLRSAVTGGAGPRLLPDLLGVNPADPGTAAAFNHQGVLPGQCQTCHNGQVAKGQPAKHVVTRASCDSCHRNTAWTPAQFNHQGTLAGQCQVCHNGTAGTGKSSGHFFTSRSCDACHRTLAWVPVTYSHLAPGYRPAVDKPTCISCHITNGEIIPRQLRGGPRPRPIPVTP